MTIIGDFVLQNNSEQELNRYVELINNAKKFGAMIIGDFRNTSITMKPCIEYLRNALTNAGINVAIHNNRKCPRTNKVLFIFANVWAIYKWGGPKLGKWIGLQTEHLNYRLGNEKYYKNFLKRCDQVWDFGYRYFVGTNTFFFPHMFYTSRLWSKELNEKFQIDVAIAGKRDNKRKRVFDKLGKYKRTCINDLNPRETINLFKQVRVAPMIPRQDGNFELHRFASLIAAGTCIISVKPSKENERVADLFSNAVVFVSYENIIKAIKTYLEHPEMIHEQRKKAFKWFKEQNVEYLVKEVYDKINDTNPSAQEEAKSSEKGDETTKCSE